MSEKSHLIYFKCKNNYFKLDQEIEKNQIAPFVIKKDESGRINGYLPINLSQKSSLINRFKKEKIRKFENQ